MEAGADELTGMITYKSAPTKLIIYGNPVVIGARIDNLRRPPLIARPAVVVELDTVSELTVRDVKFSVPVVIELQLTEPATFKFFAIPIPPLVISDPVDELVDCVTSVIDTGVENDNPELNVAVAAVILLQDTVPVDVILPPKKQLPDDTFREN